MQRDRGLVFLEYAAGADMDYPSLESDHRQTDTSQFRG